MNAILKKKYIYLDKKPKEDIIKGLRIKLDKPFDNKTDFYADIKRGEIKYSIPEFPKDVKIIKVEVVETEPIKNTEGTETAETPEKKTIADVVVPSTGEVILSYSAEKNGEAFIDLAIAMAKKKGLKVVFR